MKELCYPFDSEFLLRKKRSLKRKLLENTDTKFVEKNIAVLCGSTANDIVDMLELFLLNNGIKPSFYISEYGKYWEDVMFDNPELTEFKPDIIYIHTTSRNITDFPTINDSVDDIKKLLDNQYAHFASMWQKIDETYQCSIIQNNFEQPFYRLLGNRETYDPHARLNFINKLNDMFYEYALVHDNFHINDINYMASLYGLQKWAAPSYWYMYKYAMDVKAIPEFSYNLANIVKSIYGKNKKAMVLDLDNTLWGGIIGDDGPENIEIGHETPTAEMFTEFQEYVRAHKDIGIMLNVDSKNFEEVATEGFERPDSVLKKDDFLIFKANWDPKDMNLVQIAQEINIGTDSLVFIDDNPAERHIISEQVQDVAVPEMGEPDTYINILDRSGFFEVTSISDDDLKKASMYKANVERANLQTSFADYGEYLKSLEMTAEIAPFNEMYMSRISQLTNKSNQFNLTTKRCSVADIQSISEDPKYITLYGKLSDRFGDNGVVAITFGHEDDEKKFHIDLWLMSCRVLKRDMENAMMDKLHEECMKRGITEIYGYFYPTAKNKMVVDFYDTMGFDKVSEEEDGSSVWVLKVSDDYVNKNEHIELEEVK